MKNKFFLFSLFFFFSFAWFSTVKADIVFVDLPYIIERSHQMSWFQFFALFFLFLIIIKFLFFFAFGSRRVINYVWLFIAVLVGFCLNLFFSLMGNNEETTLIMFIFGSIVGFFTEYFILKFALGRYYSIKEIRLFVISTSVIAFLLEIFIIIFPFFLS
jgi:hypothetical protein